MGQILIRQLDDAVVAALEARARANARSVEEEARVILLETLVLVPQRRSLSDFIGAVPTGRTQADIDAEVAALRDEWN